MGSDSSTKYYSRQQFGSAPISLLQNHANGVAKGKRLGPRVCSPALFSYLTPQNVNTTIVVEVDPHESSAGRKQSPINLVDRGAVVLPSAGSLIRNYRPAPALLINSGHDIQVDWIGDAGGVLINGIEYKLEHCHWHIPAEHTLDGSKNVMELHIVHTDSRGDIAVIGVLHKFGAPDPFLAQIYPHLISDVDHEDGTDVGIVDPCDIQFESNEYYRYNGSLTTPPFSENVLWTVIKKVNTVSREQVKALQDAVDDGCVGNARPIQPLNGRTIHLYQPRICFNSIYNTTK
ncbi:hypothetical protein ACJIZ3_025816 [Penstemon smallii]|uniref:Alpha-carbonic anhydrase domain-containing protein n=1 Tax=Penstemon smallii TaxID=265156 RepID=A0ABD3TYA0_9LAMI